MEETKNKNVKKIVLGIILAGVIIGLITCFVIAYNNTKASSIISTLTQNGAKKVEIKNAQNTIVSESAILGTGYKVFITNETQTVSYTIVIKGDTSGDGQITILDLLQVLKHIKGDKSLWEK